MTDCADSRWMPPSPHREAILDVLRRGRAHIEERGHDLSPLFVYEDGGAMELSLLRVVDGTLMAVADAALPETSTKHVDVCGTIDELKRLWEQQPELADTDAARLHELLAHVRHRRPQGDRDEAQPAPGRREHACRRGGWDAGERQTAGLLDRLRRRLSAAAAACGAAAGTRGAGAGCWGSRWNCRAPSASGRGCRRRKGLTRSAERRRRPGLCGPQTWPLCPRRRARR
jgi:hypothetical protein